MTAIDTSREAVTLLADELHRMAQQNRAEADRNPAVRRPYNNMADKGEQVAATLHALLREREGWRGIAEGKDAVIAQITAGRAARDEHMVRQGIAAMLAAVIGQALYRPGHNVKVKMVAQRLDVPAIAAAYAPENGCGNG